MIKEFVARYEEKKDELEKILSKKHPDTYKDIVEAVITVLHNKDEGGSIDPARIREVDDGSYQGVLVYIIASNDYQPSDYWYVFISYGSCSGCDTLYGIRGSDYEEKPSPEQIKDYMTLALHIVQGLKKME